MKYLWLLLLTTTTFLANAQQAQERFGKNRLQHKEFDWRYYSSNNFDVYYYYGGQELAHEAIQYLESQFERITDAVGYHPYSKAKILIYNSTADLEQSNIGLNNNPFALGGETEFLKPMVEVAFPGTISGFKERLAEDLSSLLINEMMFGGSLKDMFQNAMLMNLPEWFMRGASKYVANGWNKEMDDYTRQLLRKKKINFNRFYGEEAALAGQSLWNFIAEKYGKSNISNILNYTRIIRNEEKSIAITLGLPFDRVLEEWKKYYQGINQNINDSYITPEDSMLLKQRKKYNLTTVKLSPEGNRLAYVLNERGRYSIMVRDLNTGKEFEAMDGGYKRYDQEVNYKMPLISWADENTLGAITQNNDEVIFWLYDVYTKSKIPRPLRQIDQVVSFDFNTNGRLAILSAYSRGENDLFLISSRRDRVRRLFKDPFDDIDPIFMPNSNVIIFSSNRINDSIKSEKISIEASSTNYNIFAYHLDTTKNVLARITNTVSRDVQPLASPDEKIYFLSDQKGITNLYVINPQTGIYRQITNYDVSIVDYDIYFEKNIFTAIMPELGENQLYVDHNFNLDKQIFTPTTPRKQLKQIRDFQQRKSVKSSEGKTFKEIINERLAQQTPQKDTTAIPDSLGSVDIESIRINEVPLRVRTEFDSLEVEEDSVTMLNEPAKDNVVIDTDDYQFEDEVVEANQPSLILERYRKRARGLNIRGPFDYETRFSADYLVTSFIFDPLKNFNIVLEAEMTDMMEDHKFRGHIAVNPDLKNGDLSLEYSYLKERIDFHARYERETLEWTRGATHQYKRNALIFGASLPFNVKTRLSVSPFIANTIFEDLGGPNSPLNTQPSLSREYGGARIDFVYDNSLTTGLNIISGTRGKVSLTHWEGLDEKEFSFSNFYMDIRHYQPIYKEIIFAARGFYGRYFGSSPKQYALGGMDNWVFREENTNGVGNPFASTEKDKTDLLFLEFATPLRGFDYATLYGTDALLLNLELRVPIVRALHSGPISSNFFRNLQFIGFYDIGSSWTGKSPFENTNTISSQQIREGAFVIDIKNYRNPWLSSYGVGMRTIIFGYYMKFDLAWPIEDYVVSDPRFLVTLGYDF